MKTKTFVFVAAALILVESLKAQIVVEMEKQGNLFAIPCKVNGLPIKLLFDTGASGVSISLTEAMFMLKNGYLSEDDIGGTVYSQIANGDIVENTEILIKEIEIGGMKITNIKAMVSNTVSAPLLLGQSVIQQLGPIQLEGNKLIILNGEDSVSNDAAFKLYNRAYQENEVKEYGKAVKSAKTGIKCASDAKLKMALYDELGTAYAGLDMADSAMAAWQKALIIFPNKTTAHHIGHALYVLNRKDVAYKYFKQCIQIDEPGAEEENNILYRAYGYMADIDYENRNYREAEDNALKSYKIKQTSWMCFTLAKIYESQKRISDAIKYYEWGISFDPERPSNVKYYTALGKLYFEQHNGEKAAEKFMKSISIYKDYRRIIEKRGFEKEVNDTALREAAYTSAALLGSMFYIAKQYDYAEQMLYEALMFNDKIFSDAIYYVMFAKSSMISGHPDNSVAAIIEGLKYFPENPDLLYFYSNVLDSSMLQQKIDILKNILKHEGIYKSREFDYGTIYNNIAWQYCLLGEYMSGLPYSKKAVILNPEHSYSWETLGEIYYYLGRYSDCIDAMEQCIKLNNNLKEAYQFIGNSKLNMGQKREGRKYLDKARGL